MNGARAADQIANYCRWGFWLGLTGCIFGSVSAVFMGCILLAGS